MSKEDAVLIENNSIPIPWIGCWIWLGWNNKPNRANTHALEYGRLAIDGKKFLAHRLSWMAFKGEIPEGMKVLHSCDNALCVNPQHLFLGTQKDNVIDRQKKGRTKLPRISLTLEIAREIKLSALPARELAKRYGVTTGAIYGIRSGHTWKSA